MFAVVNLNGAISPCINCESHPPTSECGRCTFSVEAEPLSHASPVNYCSLVLTNFGNRLLKKFDCCRLGWAVAIRFEVVRFIVNLVPRLVRKSLGTRLVHSAVVSTIQLGSQEVLRDYEIASDTIFGGQ